MMSSSSKPPTARPTAADRVLHAGVDALTATGLQLGLTNISMEDAIAAAGVSRATAYRRWSSCRDFISDVLVEAIKRTELMPEDAEDLRALLTLVTSTKKDLNTEQGRRNIVVEGLRISLRADISRMAVSQQWRTLLSLSALHHSLNDPKIKKQVSAALHESEVRFDAHREGVYRGLASLIGYRPASVSTLLKVTNAADDHRIDGTDSFTELSIASGTMMRGVILRGLPDSTWLTRRTPARLFGSTILAEWSVPERMLTRLILSHLEPDPSIKWTRELIAARVEQATSLIQRLYAEGAPSPAYARFTPDR